MARRKAAAKSAPQPLLSDQARLALKHLGIRSLGLGLMAVGLVLAAALLTYHPLDPSPSMATDPSMVANWLGLPGAWFADVMMQSLGIAAHLLVFSVVWWGVRTFRLVPPDRLALRLPSLLFGTLFAAAALARLPVWGGFYGGMEFGGAAGELSLVLIGKGFAPLTGEAGAHVSAAAMSAVVGLGLLGVANRITARNWALLLAGPARLMGAGMGAGVTAARTAARASVGKLGEALDERRERVEAAAADAEAEQARQETAEPAAKKTRKPRIRIGGPKLTEQTSEPAAQPEEESPPWEDKQPDMAPAAPEQARKKKLVVQSSTTQIPTGEREADEAQRGLALHVSGGEDYQLPKLGFLHQPGPEERAGGPNEAQLEANAAMLEGVLADYGVQGEIVGVRPGPVVTLYELEPAPGTKTSRVVGLSEDIARSMSAVSVRVAVIPGRSVIGIEIPNAKRETVWLRELLGARDYEKSRAKLPLAMGKEIGGEPVIADLAKMPHLLVAGTTGSGKSVAINTMLMSLLYRMKPEECRFIMIDPKMLEMSIYADIPHLLTPVVTDPTKALVALKWAVREMDRRYHAMSQLNVRNIDGYNKRLRGARETGEVLTHTVQTGYDPDTGKPVHEEVQIDLTPLPYIVVVVDEYADLMLTAGKEIEICMQRLAQKARAAGIHVIMATQRPTTDVVTGTIKSNFPTRVSFAVTSKINSRTILEEQGAEQLLGMGDMLYMPNGGRLTRVHGPFVQDEEVEEITNFIRAQGQPNYLDEVTEGDEEEGVPVGSGFAVIEGGKPKPGASGDELFDKAVDVVAREQKASTSFIQRHLGIGYNRAAKIIEQMEKEGMVSPANHVGKRDVLLRDPMEAEG
ncbi:MAG: hypothetical protein Alpg2KO_05640 [Alphaproteobacteria bacterium]